MKMRRKSEPMAGQAKARALVSDFAFSFVGKSIEECVRWLQAALEDVALIRRHFTALSMHSTDDDTALICCTNQKPELQYFPYRTDLAVMVSKTVVGTKFNEAGGEARSEQGRAVFVDLR